MKTRKQYTKLVIEESLMLVKMLMKPKYTPIRIFKDKLQYEHTHDKILCKNKNYNIDLHLCIQCL